MSIFKREILRGLDKVPTPNHPGSIICTGDSQAVLTAETGDVFIAACKYGKLNSTKKVFVFKTFDSLSTGNGKIVATGHDCYLIWLHEEENQLTVNFMNNLKHWLTGESIDDSMIIDFGDAIKNSEPLDNYKLIKWHHDFDPEEEEIQMLLSYVENGG